MKIALIGYGKMGKAIEEIALERGHTIVAKVSSEKLLSDTDLSTVDVAIEFTKPEYIIGSPLKNIELLSTINF